MVVIGDVVSHVEELDSSANLDAELRVRWTPVLSVVCSKSIVWTCLVVSRYPLIGVALAW